MEELEQPCMRCEEKEAVYFDDDNAYCNSCLGYLEAGAESMEDARKEE